MPRTKFIQGGENIYIENYKTLMKKLKKTQVTGKVFCDMRWKNHYVKLPIL